MRRENTDDKKEITIVGIVKELKHCRKPYRIGIAAENDLYVVKPNEEEHNLLYEVGCGLVNSVTEGWTKYCNPLLPRRPN